MLQKGIVWPILNRDAQNRFGIENLKKMVAFAVECSNRVKAVFADGRLSIWEAMGSIPLLRSGADLAGTSAQILTELQDLTEGELLEIIEHVGNSFDLPTDHAREIVSRIAVPALQMVFFATQIAQASKELL